MLRVRRLIERFKSGKSAAVLRLLPSICGGNIATSTSHLHHEVDILAESDNCSADHFALDVRHLYDQYFHISCRKDERSYE